MSDFFDLINRRESCRDYDGRPVEREKLLACLQAARIAPSACNSQPWRYFVISGETVPEIAKLTQLAGQNRFTDKAAAFAVVVEEEAVLSKLAGSVVGSHQAFAQIDIGLSVMQFCLAAAEQGLGTCILGIFDENAIKKLLDIPKPRRVRLVISVGYPATDQIRQKRRKPLEEIAEFID
jgi:nitroreductase